MKLHILHESVIRKKISYKGKNYSYVIYLDKEDYDTYGIKVGYEDSFGYDYISGAIYIDGNTATTDIHKIGKKLPRGIGLFVYNKMLKYIQAYARMNNKEITHDVSREPFGSNKLPKAAWEKIFVKGPLADYINYEEDKYRKTYKAHSV